MKKVIIPLLLLIVFSAYTLYVMVTTSQPLLDFGIELMSSLDTAQVVIDLYIMAGLACAWMYFDNKKRGRSFISLIPYFFITVIFVSIGPLLYLVLRYGKDVQIKKKV
ncbi:DUF2834 domain-containing protein [Zooshikella sp. RANM57]|uniref:DUF2834 domain-containing protein n=1 Tax=Zooshikella sp. RANM57 TaxID=3425863 RepID=UPI003D6E5AB4